MCGEFEWEICIGRMGIYCMMGTSRGRTYCGERDARNWWEGDSLAIGGV